MLGLLRRVARLRRLPRSLFDVMNLILAEVRGLYDVLSGLQESVVAVDRRVQHGSRDGGELSDEAVAFLLKQRVAMAKSAEHDSWMRETLAAAAEHIERTRRDVEEMRGQVAAGQSEMSELRRQVAQLRAAIDRGDFATGQPLVRSS